ncbi:MAG: hypothetical protein WAO58_10415 [Fimbriimonadaceae bacterium]
MSRRRWLYLAIGLFAAGYGALWWAAKGVAEEPDAPPEWLGNVLGITGLAMWALAIGIVLYVGLWLCGPGPKR